MQKANNTKKNKPKASIRFSKPIITRVRTSSKNMDSIFSMVQPINGITFLYGSAQRTLSENW